MKHAGRIQYMSILVNMMPDTARREITRDTALQKDGITNAPAAQHLLNNDHKTM